MSKLNDVLAPFLHQANEHVEMEDENRVGLRFVRQCLIDLHLSAGVEEDTAKAKVLMEQLRDNVDKIRANYWQWRINKLG